MMMNSAIFVSPYPDKEHHNMSRKVMTSKVYEALKQNQHWSLVLQRLFKGQLFKGTVVQGDFISK